MIVINGELKKMPQHLLKKGGVQKRRRKQKHDKIIW